MTLARSEAEQLTGMEIDEQIYRLGKRRIIVVPKMLEFQTWLGWVTSYSKRQFI